MAYITRGELRSYLGITGSEHDSVLDQMISSASERVDRYTHRVHNDTLGSGFLTHTNTSERHWLKGEDRVLLDEWPVTSVDSVIHDGDTLIANQDYYVDQRRGVVTFIPNSDPSSRERLFGRLEVTYEAGFSTVPDAVKIACLRLGGYWFSRKGAEGMGAQLISDLQETFRIPEARRILKEELSDFVLTI